MDNLVIATTDSYKYLPLDRALEGLSRIGFLQIELLGASEWTPHYDPSTATSSDRTRLLAALDRYNLQIASLSGHSNLATPEGLGKFRDRLEFAASLNIPIVNTGVGTLSSTDLRDSFHQNILRIAAWAADMGITVALEPHGDWAPSGRVLADMIRKIGAPNIRINYDTANVIYYSGERPEKDVVSAADLIAHVHMKDKVGGRKEWNFPGLGKGEVDFPRILGILEQHGYQGPFSIEIELTPETERDAELIDQAFRDSLAYLRGLNRFTRLPGGDESGRPAAGSLD
jgi:sugar phosphate isomerase/epimerase